MNLPAGGAHLLLTVPGNKWFVLTDARFNSALEAHRLDVVEVLPSGSETVKIDSLAPMAAIPYASSTGIPFAPGSRVAIRNSSAVGQPPAGTGYNITGYFADTR